MGNGPEEYTGISNVIFDEKNEEVFVNAANSPRILVYSLAGVYKRALTLPDNIRNRTIYYFDDETLLVYDVTGLRADEYKEDPYLFVSKRDGGIVSTLDFRLPSRYATMTAPLYSITGEIRQPPIMFAIPNNIHFGEDFVIADLSSDTIYRLNVKNKKLVPLLVRKPSVHESSQFKTMLASMFTTDKFMFLWKVALDIDAALDNRDVFTRLMCEIETGMTYNVRFINDDCPFEEWTSYTENLNIGKNMTAVLIDVVMIKDALEEGKLKGDLERLTPSLGEEDNPIVMILKFK